MIKIVNESKVTDYMSSDELHNFISTHMKELGFPDSYKQHEGMIIETRNHGEAFGGVSTISRFWKFVKTGNEWEFYEVDKDGWTI